MYLSDDLPWNVINDNRKFQPSVFLVYLALGHLKIRVYLQNLNEKILNNFTNHCHMCIFKNTPTLKILTGTDCVT